MKTRWHQPSPGERRFNPLDFTGHILIQVCLYGYGKKTLPVPSQLLQPPKPMCGGQTWVQEAVGASYKVGRCGIWEPLAARSPSVVARPGQPLFPGPTLQLPPGATCFGTLLLDLAPSTWSLKVTLTSSGEVSSGTSSAGPVASWPLPAGPVLPGPRATASTLPDPGWNFLESRGSPSCLLTCTAALPVAERYIP